MHACCCSSDDAGSPRRHAAGICVGTFLRVGAATVGAAAPAHPAYSERVCSTGPDMHLLKGGLPAEGVPCRDDGVADLHLAVQPVCAPLRLRAAFLAQRGARPGGGSMHLLMAVSPGHGEAAPAQPLVVFLGTLAPMAMVQSHTCNRPLVHLAGQNTGSGKGRNLADRLELPGLACRTRWEGTPRRS